MAEESKDGQEKTEEATDDRREQFRQRGEVAHSREFTSVFILLSTVAFISYYTLIGFEKLFFIFRSQLERIANFRIQQNNFLAYSQSMWASFLSIIIPIFLVTISVATLSTLAQTKFNLSWERLKPNFGKLNPMSGFKRMFSSQALVELLKSLGKMASVGLVSYLILYSEKSNVPALLSLDITYAWQYWGNITKLLFCSVAALLLVIAGGDYFYNFMTLEQKMKLTKQEVKEEYKQKEVDPHTRGRLRRLQREYSTRKIVDATKSATVVITNPTHFAVALKYEIGMGAPIVLAKGADYMALRMREISSEFDIPIVENPPLARALYKTTEIEEEIPATLYKAVSEIIKYVFKIKGIRVSQT